MKAHPIPVAMVPSLALGVCAAVTWSSLQDERNIPSRSSGTGSLQADQPAELESRLTADQRDVVNKERDPVQRRFLVTLFYRRANLSDSTIDLKPFLQELSSFDPASASEGSERRIAASLGLFAATIGKFKELPNLRDVLIRDAVKAAKFADEPTQSTALTLLRLIQSDPSGKGLPPDAEKVVEQLSARGFIKMTSDRQIEIYTAPAK